MSQPSYKLRVSVNQDVCVGAGLCVLSTAEVFDQRDEDGVVTLKMEEPPEEFYEKVMGAVRKCPSKAISVEQIPNES
jgi:ferredoxin